MRQFWMAATVTCGEIDCVKQTFQVAQVDPLFGVYRFTGPQRIRRENDQMEAYSLPAGRSKVCPTEKWFILHHCLVRLYN
eukprot:COSAG05_NODE_4240_length_1608_cov_2584.713718_3_plen_80_part_00